jgi:hypothetical protein
VREWILGIVKAALEPYFDVLNARLTRITNDTEVQISHIAVDVLEAKARAHQALNSVEALADQVAGVTSRLGVIQGDSAQTAMAMSGLRETLDRIGDAMTKDVYRIVAQVVAAESSAVRTTQQATEAVIGAVQTSAKETGEQVRALNRVPAMTPAALYVWDAVSYAAGKWARDPGKPDDRQREVFQWSRLALAEKHKEATDAELETFLAIYDYMH